MYQIAAATTKVEKLVYEYASLRTDIKEKLMRLKEEPRKANGAHPLHGKLAGK